MNRQKSVVLFAAIAAVATLTISLSGVSATPLMVSSAPLSQEGMGGFLGHVEYTVMDNSGKVTGYYQADNTVVTDGKDCTARYLFGTTEAVGGDGQDKGECLGDLNDTFQYIAIGNYSTGAPTSGADTLESHGSSICADSSAGGGSGLTPDNGGEMARLEVTPTIITNATGSAGVVVELEVGTPFAFDSDNATTVAQSGIFNGKSTDDTNGTYEDTVGNGQCETPGAVHTDWNMFAAQHLASGSGITVTDGDSLSVKWTITIGGS